MAGFFYPFVSVLHCLLLCVICGFGVFLSVWYSTLTAVVFFTFLTDLFVSCGTLFMSFDFGERFNFTLEMCCAKKHLRLLTDVKDQTGTVI